VSNRRGVSRACLTIRSSHMIDLSEESNEENIETCVKYFTRMAKMNRRSSPQVVEQLLTPAQNGSRWRSV
jgi:fructose/tagatose bisphosphate aldolase